MSLTSGFYDSLDSDRVYSATQFGSMFDGLISDGIFATYGGAFLVSPSSNLQLSVASGRAWFDNTWTYNDSALLISVDAAGAALPRIDLIVLETNKGSGVRANSIKVVKGTGNVTPVEPALTNTDDIKQYPLASIYVAANVTEITGSDITNKVGTTECPFVTGIIDTITTDDLLAQWNAEFTEWFDNVVIILDGEVAGALLNKIEALEDIVRDTAIYLVVFNHEEVLSVGTGIKYFTIIPELNGTDLLSVSAFIKTASSADPVKIQLSRGRRATPSSALTFNDILTTKITIDQDEFSSLDAVQPVVGETYKGVLTGDVIGIDIEEIGTGTKGLDIGLVFRLP